MASTVREKDIKKLREAGYLAKKIGHRLPSAGQVVPTLEPHERVMFLPHFVRGLGFPLHPFVCGVMYYYGIDFHDLSPQFFSQYLDVHHRVRGFSPDPTSLRPMAEDLQC